MIEAARTADYYVALHVLMVPVELSVTLVAARVRAGGHDVPTDKIRAKLDRLWDNVAAAITRADTAACWDNSGHDGPLTVALFTHGFPVGTPAWPGWAPSALQDRRTNSHIL